MAKGYAPQRFPAEAFKAFKVKQQKMEEMMKKITGKPKKIPMTKVITAVAKEPTYLSDTDLIKYFKEKRKRRC